MCIVVNMDRIVNIMDSLRFTMMSVTWVTRNHDMLIDQHVCRNMACTERVLNTIHGYTYDTLFEFFL